MDNRFNKVFPFFSPFNNEFSLGNRLENKFPSCSSFHSLNRKSKQDFKNLLQHLDNITIQVFSDPLSMIVVIDISIKNQVAMLIAHIYSKNNPIIKTIHHIVNIMFTKAEIFAIRCDINQVTHFLNVN